MKRNTSGFTIIELVSVITIIAILTALGIYAFLKIQASARDSQRLSKVTIIAESLEKYYNKYGEYPSCTDMTKSASTVVSDTLIGIKAEVLATPTSSSGTNSILSDCVSLSAGVDAFAYAGVGGDCLTSNCLQWTLQYQEEATGLIKSISSRHISIVMPNAPVAPVITMSLNVNNVLATITPVACNTGSGQYRFKNRINDGTWSGWTTWSNTLTATQLATDGVKYGYQAQARCYIDATAYSPTISGVESTYIDPITTPTTPVVTASTVDATTTYSWNAASCPANTTARYQYRYVIDYYGGYTSVWYGVNSLSSTFTTSEEGFQFTGEVQSQCYNSNISSSWSGTGSASYIRPIVLPGNITFSIARIAGNEIEVSGAAICDSSTDIYLFAREDVYLTATYGTSNNHWSDTGVAGWWADSHAGVWVVNNFSYFTGPFSIGVTQSNGDYEVGMPWKMAAEIRCQNVTTGRVSPSIGRQESESLLTPAL